MKTIQELKMEYSIKQRQCQSLRESVEETYNDAMKTSETVSSPEKKDKSYQYVSPIKRITVLPKVMPYVPVDARDSPSERFSKKWSNFDTIYVSRTETTPYSPNHSSSPPESPMRKSNYEEEEEEKQNQQNSQQEEQQNKTEQKQEKSSSKQTLSPNSSANTSKTESPKKTKPQKSERQNSASPRSQSHNLSVETPKRPSPNSSRENIHSGHTPSFDIRPDFSSDSYDDETIEHKQVPIASAIGFSQSTKSSRPPTFSGDDIPLPSFDNEESQHQTNQTVQQEEEDFEEDEIEYSKETQNQSQSQNNDSKTASQVNDNETFEEEEENQEEQQNQSKTSSKIENESIEEEEEEERNEITSNMSQNVNDNKSHNSYNSNVQSKSSVNNQKLLEEEEEEEEAPNQNMTQNHDKTASEKDSRSDDDLLKLMVDSQDEISSENEHKVEEEPEPQERVLTPRIEGSYSKTSNFEEEDFDDEVKPTETTESITMPSSVHGTNSSIKQEEKQQKSPIQSKTDEKNDNSIATDIVFSSSDDLGVNDTEQQGSKAVVSDISFDFEDEDENEKEKQNESESSKNNSALSFDDDEDDANQSKETETKDQNTKEGTGSTLSYPSSIN